MAEDDDDGTDEDGAAQGIPLIEGMLLGRLELLAVLVLFTPQFWRK